MGRVGLGQVRHDHGARGRRVGGVHGNLVEIGHEAAVAILLGPRHVVGGVAARKPERPFRTGDNFQEFTLVRIQAGASGRRFLRFFINVAQQLSIRASDAGLVRERALAERFNDQRVQRRRAVAIPPVGVGDDRSGSQGKTFRGQGHEFRPGAKHAVVPAGALFEKTSRAQHQARAKIFRDE